MTQIAACGDHRRPMECDRHSPRTGIERRSASSVCLVTGGGGFLGSNIARALRARGDSVAVFGRRRYPALEALGIRCIVGDLRDAAAVRDACRGVKEACRGVDAARQGVDEACRGVDIVFHVGALTGIWGRRRDFHEVNVVGTQNVLAACREHGIGRLVFTSSPSVVFGDEPLTGVDERQPYPPRYLADYPATKAAAEQMVLEANGPALATVALRPHLIFGPGDPHLIPRVIARARAGKLAIVGDGKCLVDVTYIDNAAEAHLLAADRLAPGAACAGRAYFISQGEPVRLWDWLNGLLARLGVPPGRRRVSYRIAYAAGAVLEAAHRAFRLRGELRMTRFLAAQLALDHYFDISAARKDLGYVPRVTTAEGVDRLVSGFSESLVGSPADRAG